MIEKYAKAFIVHNVYNTIGKHSFKTFGFRIRVFKKIATP